MKATPTQIPDLWVLEPTVFEDHRGYFFESFNARKAEKALGFALPEFVQDNQSKSQYGVLRGLHFQQAPHGQTKLIRVISGTIYDVAVDIRSESPTYGQWEGVLLSDTNRKQLYIPKGFAHGFVVLSQQAEILYKCDNFYAPESEGVLYYADPELDIDWQLQKDDLILSDKDKKGTRFSELSDLRF